MQVPFYLDPRYTVCSDGTILGLSGKQLKFAKNQSGYMFFNFWLNGKRKTHVVHRAILKSFSPEPEGSPVVNHIDGNKENNSLDNLEWCSYSQNTNHAIKILNKDFAKNSRKEVIAVSLDGLTKKTFKSLTDCAADLQVSIAQVCRVLKGLRKSANGYKIYYSESC